MPVSFLECLLHGVHGRKRVHGTIEKERAELATRSACVIYGAAAKLPQVTCLRFLKCVHHGVHGRKRVYSTIEKEQVELTTGSECITRGRAKVLASRSSPSDKISRLEKSSG